jgi:magnesium transporter
MADPPSVRAAVHRWPDGRSTQRWTSGDSRKPFFARLWQAQRRKAKDGWSANNFPQGFLADGAATLGRSGSKVANELKLRCTEFDEKGDVTLVNGEFKKTELIAKVGGVAAGCAPC